MDDIVFYQPAMASKGLPRRHLPGTVTPATVPGASITSLSDRQTASQLNHQNEKSNAQMTKFRDGSDLSLTIRFPDQHPDQGKLTAIQNFLDSDDDDYLPDMSELFSFMTQKNASATAHLEGDDIDGFVDVDEFSSSMKQKSISACAIPKSRSMTEKMGNGFWGGSPGSSRSTEGSIQDPIILSDDEPKGPESETDYSDLDVDLTAKTDPDSPRAADRCLANGDTFASGTGFTSDRVVADHQNNGNDNDNSIVYGTELKLAPDSQKRASPGYRTLTNRAPTLRVNTEITKGSASNVDLDVTKKVEDEAIVFVKGDDDDANVDTRSMNRSRLSAISCSNPASDSDFSDSELQSGQHDSAQSPQSDPAVVSLEQSDLTNDHLRRHHRRRNATRNLGLKRPRSPAPTGLTSAASTVSAASESSDLQEAQSLSLLATPSQERETRGIDQEVVEDGGSDDSNDEDYDDMSDAATSEMQDRPHSRKRARRVKDTEQNDVTTASTHSLNVPYQAIAATSSGNMQESEEITVHGYLTLKTIESKVVYCLTFSQELLLSHHNRGQRQNSTIDLEGQQSGARASAPASMTDQEALHQQKGDRWTTEEDAIVRKMKNDGFSWEEIHNVLPHRSTGTLQVRYSTKLKRLRS